MTTIPTEGGGDLSNYLLNVMNFYELHLSTLKSMIVKQNQTIISQKDQIGNYEHNLNIYKNKVDDLEERLRSTSLSSN